MKAYDLYAKLAATFPKEALGKSASASAKKLAATPMVASELAARKVFAQVNFGLAKSLNRPMFLQSCANIAKKHASTPTGEKAAELAKELEVLVKTKK